MTVTPLLEFDLQAEGIDAALVVEEVGEQRRAASHGHTTIVLGVARGKPPPLADLAGFDLLLTSEEPYSHDWIRVDEGQLDARIAELRAAVDSAGLPAAVLTQVLRVAQHLSPKDALLVESFAFSALLGGQAFRQWLASRPGRAPAPAGPRVRCSRDDDVLSIVLCNPARRNAMDALMRDELVEALSAACDDPTRPAVVLRAEGRDFSAGGDLSEFGSAVDLTRAHAIRSLRSPVRLIQAIADRTTAYVHGACVGAGIEIPAAAGRVVASPDAQFWIPELSMGLIPGAGGTMTLARRIGRRRLLYWALTGSRLDATTAREWGLVDDIQAQA